ncbi:ecdysteroid-regulated 16 kDa protein-like [Daphnia pulex]|uniref:ecdysteroid-regulated 16 kDa protein-like n=1 Tax=Daphnia pulex TaxID=6669 RepID=UPI001EE01B52|nr:ecdysteroid-regulated 16 kDa protein-like [Daphnia pulex]
MANHLLLFVLIALPSVIYADKLLSVAACQRGGNYGTATIKEVRITPCPEAAQRRPCILKKGTNVTIEVDFEPTVAATAVTGRAFWANRMLELPLPNMNTNACATMNCPLQPNVAQTYTYNLPVSRGFPTRRYDVRWKLTAAPFNMCFQFPIQILN